MLDRAFYKLHVLLSESWASSDYAWLLRIHEVVDQTALLHDVFVGLQLRLEGVLVHDRGLLVQLSVELDRRGIVLSLFCQELLRRCTILPLHFRANPRRLSQLLDRRPLDLLIRLAYSLL